MSTSFDQTTKRFWEFRQEDLSNPIVLLFMQLLQPFYSYLDKHRMTKDLIDNPDILSFKLRESVYAEYTAKACLLTNTNWFGNRYDMFTDEKNRWYVWDKISNCFNQNYHHHGDSDLVEPILEYISGCVFFEALTDSKIIPYTKYKISQLDYAEAYQSCISIRNMMKRTYKTYKQLCEYECPPFYEGEEHRYPFKTFRLHYSEEYYNDKLFNCSPDTNTHIISFVLKNPELYQYRKDTGFSLMIYGNPMASHGLYKETMDELIELGAIRENPQ
tara:strand:+ start:151 stop:969 length:819 start_codon:yes stop_codon:yes gene_type:complete